MASVKGIVPYHLNEYLLSHHGKDGLEQVCAALTEPAAHMLRSPIAHQWYPHADFLAAEEQITRIHYGGDLSEAWRFGHFNMEESVNKVYRFLFRFLSPEVLIQKSAKLWCNFMDSGRLEFETLVARSGAMRAFEVAPASAVWCHEMRGALLGALAVCQTPAAQRSATETECVFRGGSCCRFELKW